MFRFNQQIKKEKNENEDSYSYSRSRLAVRCQSFKYSTIPTATIIEETICNYCMCIYYKIKKEITGAAAPAAAATAAWELK